MILYSYDKYLLIYYMNAISLLTMAAEGFRSLLVKAARPPRESRRAYPVTEAPCSRGRPGHQLQGSYPAASGGADP